MKTGETFSFNRFERQWGHKVKTSELLVSAVDDEATHPTPDSDEPGIDEGLGELAAQDASILTLVFTLLSIKTLPHIIALVVTSSILYAVADGNAGLAAVGFSSLTVGYAITAVASNIEAIRGWTRLQEWKENRPPLLKRVLLSARILLLPYVCALVFAVALIAFTNEGATNALAMGLGGLFVLWAVVQGRSFAAWGASVAAKKTPPSAVKRGSGYAGLLILLTVVLAFGAVCITLYSSLAQPTFIPHLDATNIAVFTGISLGAFVLMNSLTWKNRAVAMTDKSLSRFHFRWSMLAHLFVTWHLLTVYRHAVMGTDPLEVYIEEIALMIFTVFMGIWSLTSRGFGSDLKLLNQDNALPWGLAFGYAYAGSVAMISAVIGDLQQVMALGHIIAASTGIYMHRMILTKVLQRHDTSLEIQRIVEDVLPRTDSGGDERAAAATLPDAQSGHQGEDWSGELDEQWEQPKDIGIQADVEWEDVINIDD